MQVNQQILNQKRENDILRIHWRQAPVTCSRCGYTADAGLYDFMDISVHPEWKNVLLDGAFFQWICPECGECSELIYPCRYMDPAFRLTIVLRPGLDWASGAEAVNAMNSRAGGLGVPGYLRRAVGSFYSMQEIVRIREQNLDDRVVNLIKPLLIGQLQSEGKEIWNGFFTGLLPSDPRGKERGWVCYMSLDHDMDQAHEESVLWFDIHMADRTVERCGINRTAYRICEEMLQKSGAGEDDGRYHLYDLSWAIDFHNRQGEETNA